ncbi:MAG: MarR family transcriptional regulator [Propionibacteriaceae bacterium]|nr:MarR family transcriptional regulator [Propionibacteriaceae bacterium]
MGQIALVQPARVDEQLCFALYSAAKALTAAYRQALSELGLTYPQYLTMLAVWESDGRTVAELGRAIELDSGTLSPLLRRLETAGLLRRERSTTDERMVRVFATERGRELEPQAATIRLRVEAAAGLSPEEFLQLRSTLHRLRDTIAIALPHL